MARRTPAVAQQVIAPYRPSIAFLKARLIDFDTGSATLEGQHQLWLRDKVGYAAKQSNYTMWLIGYASKLGSKAGDDVRNTRLSNDRMQAVQAFSRSVDANVMSHVYGWEALGSSAYNASDKDNAPDMRAIEVHIFIGDPPPPPADLKPIRIPRAELPGQGRTANWAVAAPGGGQATIIPPILIGFNVFIFKNKDTNDLRGYIAPQVGIGWSYSINGLGTAKNAIQSILTGASYSNLEFTDIKPAVPITWEELEKCAVSVSAIGGGVGATGYQVAYTKIDAPSVQVYSSADTPMSTHMEIFGFESHGKNYQIGGGVAGLWGPLKRVD